MLTLAAALLSALLPCGCSDENTDLGSSLVDPATLYNGKTDTLYASAAYSRIDEPLKTSSYSFGVVGNYSDATFGSVSSVLYTQVALKQASTSINIEEMTIDSVELCLVNDGLYPDSTATYNFHFEVMRLAEAIVSDSDYYSNNAIPVDPSAVYFDGVVSVGPTDTVVRLTLDPSVQQMLSYTATAEEFVNLSRGLRIRIVDDGSQGMLSINFAAVKTKLVAHYHRGDNLADSASYDFVIGTGANHFTQFTHDYSTSVFAASDSIEGSQALYIEPLVGTSAYISFDSAIRAFAAEHPLAVIHQARLLMPVASSAQPAMPDRILATYDLDGTEMAVPDMLLDGFDGTFHPGDGFYALRLSRHLQHLLRQGNDPGIKLILDSRRNSPARVVLEGTRSANPTKIVFTYSE